jgi:integrase
MSKAPTFEHVGRLWHDSLSKQLRRRTGKPLSENTRSIYGRSLNRLIGHFGKAPLPITNRVLRDYIEAMHNAGYGASSIKGDVIVAKLVCESVRDDDGRPTYRMEINHDFCLTPIVKREEQVTPLASREDIERAVAMTGDVGVLVAICAGGGLRVSEALALYVGDDGIRDAWEPDRSAITIRETLKTEAAARTVYIPQELNAFLTERVSHRSRGEKMFVISRSGLYRALEDAGLPPCHSYRRFFATWRDEAGMNDEVLKSLMGHSKGGDVTDGYKFTAKKTEFVIAEVARVGLGFTLPIATRELVTA